MALEPTEDGFCLSLGGRLLIAHRRDAPCIEIGRGTERIEMYRGNFDIADDVRERRPLPCARIDGDILHFSATPDGPVLVSLALRTTETTATLTLIHADPDLNRFWFHVHAAPDEHVWGCGEQMSYFDLRHRRFPLWTSEPGVGRDKTAAITQQADAEGRAGGDYYTTNYPQPTFLSSRILCTHLDTTAYSVFDFTDPHRHTLEVWVPPARLEFFAADDFIALVGRVTQRFGRPPELPDWLYNGAVIGLKAGHASFERLDRFLAAGVHVSALWCEDWAGVRQTSFGTRLFWDWQWNPARYPDLPAQIARLHERNIRFMGYVSPYLCADGSLFPVAQAGGHLAKTADGDTYLVDFGEFDCGVLDFTRAETCMWFGDTIIRANMLDIGQSGYGMSGWMCDFGEYLPTDTQLANGVDARLMHNAWPTIWARVNADAVARAGRTGEILFFMRAGFTGSSAYCPMLWAGDQCVDFSRHDGLPTVIVAALSSGLMGHAYHHSDVGGYTSLFGNVRTLELIQRWGELCTFTAMIRTHEGNRPRENLQIDDSPEALAHFARMTRIWCHLAPYLRHLSREAASTGLPVMRPLFLHHPEDRATYAIQTEYLMGQDLLVAPVLAAGVQQWRTYLPAGADWTHIWTEVTMPGGQHVTVPAPIGQPPVFRREGSAFTALFESLAAL